MNKKNNEESRLQTILECSSIGTWEWNIQTGKALFNEVWAQIVGYTLNELAPISIKTWEALAHPDDLKKSGELLERHFSGESYSELGKGIVFHVYLPAVKKSILNAETEKVKQHQGYGTFLVMDDEEILREIISDMLGSFGYTVESLWLYGQYM